MKNILANQLAVLKLPFILLFLGDCMRACYQQQHHFMRLTPVSLAVLTVLSVSMTFSQPSFAEDLPQPVVQQNNSPNSTQQLNETLQNNQQIFDTDNYVYQVPTQQTQNQNSLSNTTDTAVLNPTENPTENNAPNSHSNQQNNANNHLRNNSNNKISTRLQNQTLTDYDNFNQPIAAFDNQHLLNDSQIQNDNSLDNAKQQQPKQQIINSQAVMDSPKDVEKTLNDIANTNNQQATINNQINQSKDLDNADVINPDDYLPSYEQDSAQIAIAKPNTTVTADSKGLISKLKNRVLNTVDGANYIDISFANADEALQPAKNIKASLEQVTVESVADFNGSINRLRQIALDAAKAVGYYETEVSFKHLGGDNIEVNLKAGEPVIVQHQLFDIRGEGAEGEQSIPDYDVIENEALPQAGDVFNHGQYEASKSAVDSVSQTHGFFDGKWLNHSVDVILPDNVADVDLVYDTQSRYQFGDIKVYSIDKEGNLTDDPDKLPIKPELLQQLMPYQKGDPYYQPLVTKLTNNLSVTRYFNSMNVDVILPADSGAGVTSQNTTPNNAQANSQNSSQANSQNNSQNNSQANSQNSDNNTADQTQIAQNQPRKNNDGDIQSQNVTADATDNPANIQNPKDYAPLEFNIDDTTQERLDIIKAKSRILLQAPEDMELAPEEKNISKNPLVILANAVSDIAKKIDKNQNDNSNDKKVQQAIAGDLVQKLTPEQVAEQKAVPTYIVLDATKPREAEVGLGYETDVGVRAIGKINNNLVNKSGYQAGISTTVSRVDQAVEVTGSLPYKHPIDDKLTGSLGYQHKQSDKLANTFEVETLYANLARNINRESGWNRTMSVRYRTDKLSLSEGNYDTDNLPYPFNNYASDFTQEALLFGYAMHKTQADNVMNPTIGYSQRYSLEVGGDGLLTDTNLAILRAGATGLYSFGDDKKHQVLGRLDLGYIYSDNFYKVPYRLRFFAGGDQSIRGFNTDTLAPTYGDQSFLMGGDALAVGSLEYNYEFREGLRLALFGDVGNAYDTTGEADNKTHVGLGTGIRWSSPIGLVRLDVATGVTDDDDPVRIHFFIGSPL